MQALTQAQRLRRAAHLRPHCQYFSRLGWALLTYMGVALAFSLASVPLVHLFPALALSPLFSWCFSVVVSYGFCFPAFCLILRGTAGSRPDVRAPLGPARFGQVLLISIAGLYLTNLLTQLLLDAVSSVRGRPVSDPLAALSVFPPILTILLTCLAAPIFEELMFRRLLLSRLLPYGDAFAVTVSALAFGLFHGNFSQFFYAFVLGWIFGYVVVRTGCLWQTILLHALVNSISTCLLPLAALHGTAAVSILGLVILAAILLGIVFAVVQRHSLTFFSGSTDLQEGEKWRLLLTSPGFLLFCLACLGQAILILAV